MDKLDTQQGELQPFILFTEQQWHGNGRTTILLRVYVYLSYSSFGRINLHYLYVGLTHNWAPGSLDLQYFCVHNKNIKPIFFFCAIFYSAFLTFRVFFLSGLIPLPPARRTL